MRGGGRLCHPFITILTSEKGSGTAQGWPISMHTEHTYEADIRSGWSHLETQKNDLTGRHIGLILMATLHCHLVTPSPSLMPNLSSLRNSDGMQSNQQNRHSSTYTSHIRIARKFLTDQGARDGKSKSVVRD